MLNSTAFRAVFYVNNSVFFSNFYVEQ